MNQAQRAGLLAISSHKGRRAVPEFVGLLIFQALEDLESVRGRTGKAAVHDVGSFRVLRP